MKEIKLVASYKELTKEALMNIINKHHAEIAHEAYVYLTDIWTDALVELEDTLNRYGIGINVMCHVDSVDSTVIIKEIFSDKEIYVMKPADFKHMLFKLLDDNGELWFKDELTAAVLAYRDENPVTFLKRFFDGIANDATDWLIKMTYDVQTVYDYVMGNYTGPYFACEDIWFMAQNITIDGQLVTISD